MKKSATDKAIDSAAKKKTPHEQKVEALTATPVVKAKQPKPDKAAKSKPADVQRKGKLGALLGHSVISVLRAMGKAGWDFDAAKAALDKAKIAAADHTIRRALKRGRNGEMRIAPLGKKELAALT